MLPKPTRSTRLSNERRESEAVRLGWSILFALTPLMLLLLWTGSARNFNSLSHFKIFINASSYCCSWVTVQLEVVSCALLYPWIGCDVQCWYGATFINCKINQNTLEKTHLIQSSDNWMMNLRPSTWVCSGLPREVIAVYFIHCWSSITIAQCWPQFLIHMCRKKKRIISGTFVVWKFIQQSLSVLCQHLMQISIERKTILFKNNYLPNNQLFLLLVKAKACPWFR